jgi:Flp pilus assembly protein TadD/peroxiredoxin
VHWPSGLAQRFEKLPINHRIEIEEGVEEFQAKPYRSSGVSSTRPGAPQNARPLPSKVETWLIEPLPAPDFALADVEGSVHTIRSFHGHPVLLHFWAMGCPASVEQLTRFEQGRPEWETQGLHMVSINVDNPPEVSAVRAFVQAKGLRQLILLADEQAIGTYSLLYRYLFDRRRDLSVPTSFLLDERGSIIKVYQGLTEPQRVIHDWISAPQSSAERVKRALPFPGKFYSGEIRRNYFTYGVTFFEHGYLDQAMACFERVVAVDQNYADAYYNLGTLCLNKEMYAEARKNLEQAVRLNPKDPDAWNNLGLLAAEQEKYEEAIRYFREALRLEPGHILALQNLVRLYRWEGQLDEARRVLEQAVELVPNDPEIRYGLATLLTEQNRPELARQQLENALRLRPDYPEALNDLGLLLLRAGQGQEAMAKFVQCMRIAAGFDQPYLNLAKIYEQTGQPQKAREILGRFLADHPQDTLVRQALDRLKR